LWVAGRWVVVMGLRSFIAESPGTFLALLGAGALGTVVVLNSGPAMPPANPWALGPAHRSLPDRLAPLKGVLERLGGRIGMHFAPAAAEPEPVPLAAPVRKARHPTRHHRRKPASA
ncbi:MAG: hypothetical protein KGN34_18815, partial [Sphingomonadales bacterium]|nr:hypothetical protein [Sphingomonadales bacterium]